MEIIDVRKNEEVEFFELSLGDIFEASGDFYVKVESFDAFNLNENRMEEFDQSTTVRKRRAKLTVY